MPEYAHTCTICGHEFAVVKPIAEASREERCPECGAESRRIWTAPNVKGSSAGSASTRGGSSCGTSGFG